MTRKEQILKAATVLFANKGYAETSTLELSEVTGVASGTIFYHFGSKEGLFLAILEDIRETIAAEFAAYFKDLSFSSGLQMIEEVVAFYLYLASTHESQFMLLQQPNTSKMAAANPNCRNHLEAIYNGLVDIFEQTLERGRRDGSIADLPVRKTALIVFSMVDGFVRLKHHNIYDAGALFHELVKLCQRMLENQTKAREPVGAD